MRPLSDTRLWSIPIGDGACLALLAIALGTALAGCKPKENVPAGETMQAMFYAWSPIECVDSLGRLEHCMVDPADSSVGHHLAIVGFYETGLCSLEVMPFFVSKTGADTAFSASDGGFWKAAGRYSMAGDTIRVEGRIESVHYMGMADSSWRQVFLRFGDTLRPVSETNPYLRNRGALRRILTGVKMDSYLSHYDP